MIRLIIKLFFIVLAIGIVAYATAFCYYNSQTVQLNLIFFDAGSFQLGILLLVIFSLGVLLSLVFSLVSLFTFKVKYSALKIKLTNAQKLLEKEQEK